LAAITVLFIKKTRILLRIRCRQYDHIG